MGLLCLHLSHGVSSLFQSLGLKNEAYAARIECFAKIAACVLFVGYSAVPLAILTGMVK
jgi:succinate dehydrogenase / fumarate reductase cytochrome b subunit